MNTRLTIAAACAGVFAAAATAQASPRSLHLDFTAFRNQQGTACVSVYAEANADAFPGTVARASAAKCFEFSEIATSAGHWRATFAGLAPGTYAVSMFHDENRDGILNTGYFGIPLEGYGFSKNPTVSMRAPTFQEAAFAIGDADATQDITVTYFGS